MEARRSMKVEDFNPKMQEQIRQQLQAKNEGHRQGQTRIEAPGSFVEPAVVNEPLGTNQGEASHSGRLVVRVESFRRRLLDEDNLAIKWAVDALRYAGIIPDDSPDKVSIKACQQKVKTKEEERTEITIVPEFYEENHPTQILTP